MKKQEILDTMKKGSKLYDIEFYNNIPIIPCWEHPEDNDLCVVLCPYCNRKHVHHLPSSDKLSHRFSHCWSGVHKNNGYYLKLKPEDPPDIITIADKIWSAVWQNRFDNGLMRQVTTATEILNRVGVNA